MLDKEIEKLRKELNDAIAEKRDYSEIYKLSIEMDELIAKYYKENNGEKIETKIYGKEDLKNGVIKMTDDGSIAKSKEEIKV